MWKRISAAVGRFTRLATSLRPGGRNAASASASGRTGSATASGNGAIAISGDVRFSLITSAPLITAPLLSIFGRGSLRADRQQLRRRTLQSLRLLRRYSYISFRGREIRIERAVTRALKAACNDGSLLLTGEPGSGKSAELYAVARELVAGGHDVVYLAADQLSAGSSGELSRELGLSHDVIEVLSSWRGEKQAYLIVDALDAARADASARTLRDLLAQVMSPSDETVGLARWKVLASIRSYDLRYAGDLAAMFDARRLTTNHDFDAAFRDPEFLAVRHLRVPLLSGTELDALVVAEPAVGDLLARSPAPVRELLRSPFNLRLATELAERGAVDLTNVRSQADLLDRYWDVRVLQAVPVTASFEREAMLREVCEEAVRTRSLTVRTASITHPGALHWALSTRVLMEGPGGSRATLAFPHHIIFDFAVSRLLLDTGATDLVSRLCADPGFVLFARPSLDFYFQGLWSRTELRSPARNEFWDSIISVARANRIPSIGKLIGASVVASRVEALTDLEPLAVRLESDAGPERDAAVQVLRHIVAAVGLEGVAAVAGAQAGCWLEFISRVTVHPRAEIVDAIWQVLAMALEHRSRLSSGQVALAAATARRLLDWERSNAEPNRWRAGHLTGWVAATYSACPDEARVLLRRAVESDYVDAVGFNEAFWLAEEAANLLEADPELVERLYDVTFSEKEQARGSSSPAPDFRLAKLFPTFIERAPAHASRALCRALKAYVELRHRETQRFAELDPENVEGEAESTVPSPDATFQVWGIDAEFRGDFSAIWDAGGVHTHDDTIVMLEAFQAALADAGRSDEAIRALILPALEQPMPAVVWRRVILSAAANPGRLGMMMRELVFAPSVLAARDITYEAGRLLEALHPLLSRGDKARLEDAILAIPGLGASSYWNAEGLEHLRDRLLTCIPRDALVTGGAKTRAEQLSALDERPSNQPLFGPVQVSSSAYSDEERLADEGVPVHAPANVRLREDAATPRDFATRFANETPTPQDCNEVFPALQQLRKTLAETEDAAHAIQREEAFDDLADACAAIAKCKGLNGRSSLGEFVRDVLLEAGQHASPTPDGPQEGFDRFPSWGGRSPRVAAAQGLTSLSVNPSFDRLVGEEVARLAEDPAKEVRYQVALRLGRHVRGDLLLGTTRARELVVRRASEEQSPPILMALVDSLRHAGCSDPEYVRFSVDLLLSVLERVSSDCEPDGVRSRTLLAILEADLWCQDERARNAVDTFVSGAPSCPGLASRFVSFLRDCLTLGKPEEVENDSHTARSRAVSIVVQLANLASSQQVTIRSRYASRPLTEWRPEDRDEYQASTKLLAHVATELFFASGAFDEDRQRDTARQQMPVRRRFFAELAPVIGLLVRLPAAEQGRHTLEMLAFLAKAAPAEVLPAIAALLAGLEETGQLGEAGIGPEAAACLEWYLAAQRSIFRNDPALVEALLSSLDVLVRAGVTQALRIAYRAEDIYR